MTKRLAMKKGLCDIGIYEKTIEAIKSKRKKYKEYQTAIIEEKDGGYSLYIELKYIKDKLLKDYEKKLSQTTIENI